MAASQILHEGVPGDDNLGCPISLESSHRSQPPLQLAVIGFDRIVLVLLDVVPGRGQQLVEHGGVNRRGVGDDLAGITLSVRSARVKNRRAAAASRRAKSSTSMT